MKKRVMLVGLIVAVIVLLSACGVAPHPDPYYEAGNNLDSSGEDSSQNIDTVVEENADQASEAVENDCAGENCEQASDDDEMPAHPHPFQFQTWDQRVLERWSPRPGIRRPWPGVTTRRL